MLIIFVGVFSALFVVPARSAKAASCGDVLVSGSSWAGGNGVDVHSNGPDEGTINSCAGDNAVRDLHAAPPQYGLGWQCVELAIRMYVTQGWQNGSWSSVGIAADIYNNASLNGMTTTANGSIVLSNVVPGDMIVTHEGNAGHVMLVDYIDGNTIHYVDQNGEDGGRGTATYNPTAKTISAGSYYQISGVVHDPDNHLANGSGSVGTDGYFHGVPPNGAVIENHDGGLHKYVALGGSLFWIPEDGSVWDYVNQMESLFPTGTFHQIVWMHDSDIHTIEFGYPSGGREHPPGDNSFFYERGSPTQYVVQYGFSFSIGSAEEVTYLGGQNKAIMVPATNVAGRLAGVPSIPNDVLLQAYGNPAIYHEVNGTAFWADNTTVVDCVIVAKHGAIQPVPASLMSTLWSAGKVSTNVTHCSFPPNWALYGPGGAERWWIDGANPYTRHLYVSPLALRCRLGSVPTEVQLPDTDGINSPVQGSDLDCPNGSLVRITSTGEVFQVWSSVLHYVPWQATLSCLTGGHPERVIDIDGAVVATTPRGDWAQCSLEGKLIQSPSGSIDYIVNGARHHILTWAVVNCLEGRRNTGSPVVVDQATFDSYPDSGVYAYCPYEDEAGLNFVQEQGSDIVWLVGPAAGQPGSKRHAGTLCVPDPYTTTIKAAHVFVVPAGETAGLSQGADWWPTSQDCQSLPTG